MRTPLWARDGTGGGGGRPSERRGRDSGLRAADRWYALFLPPASTLAFVFETLGDEEISGSLEEDCSAVSLSDLLISWRIQAFRFSEPVCGVLRPAFREP